MEHGKLVALGTPADLAAQMGDSQRVEVVIADESLAAALEILRGAQVHNGRAGEHTLLFRACHTSAYRRWLPGWLRPR